MMRCIVEPFSCKGGKGVETANVFPGFGLAYGFRLLVTTGMSASP
jgi:hypothetical protein